MIENKIVTIRKSNTFDKGWALVTPYQAEFIKNKQFSSLSVIEIVRAITKSTGVNLILSEVCLSSQIVNELEWVNKYVSINLIAKSKEIASFYPQLKFSKLEIDESIDFNYIAIKGKTEIYALKAEDYVATDDTLNKVYFEKTTIAANSDFIKKAKSVIFVDENYNKDYKNLLEICLKAEIPTAYLVGVKAYGQQVVHKFLNLDVKLLCSENVRNGILYSTHDGRLYCANLTNKGIYVSVEIENATFYFGQVFESLKSSDIINVNKIPNGSYVCDSVIFPLKIAEEKVIKRTVKIAEMEDFVEEKFDKSETDKHNQYCTEAKYVVYNFTLVPPVFKTDKISDIYNGVEAVYANWQDNLKTIDLLNIIKFLKELELNESGICLMCEAIIGFNKRLAVMIKEHKFNNYYFEIKNLKEVINYCSIEEYCKELFIKVNSESSETKFDNIDKEIAGYRQIIEEKKTLINESMVKRLEEKIAKLTAMKQRFSGSAAARDNKQLDSFLTVCNQVISGKFVEEKREIDSIGNVLASKESTKIAKLEAFIKSYLCEFNRFLISAQGLVKQFESIDIPTDYIVYEQDGQRVIAIESEKEYYDSENIRKRFNLHCKARR